MANFRSSVNRSCRDIGASREERIANVKNTPSFDPSQCAGIMELYSRPCGFHDEQREDMILSASGFDSPQNEKILERPVGMNLRQHRMRQRGAMIIGAFVLLLITGGASD